MPEIARSNPETAVRQLVSVLRSSLDQVPRSSVVDWRGIDPVALLAVASAHGLSGLAWRAISSDHVPPQFVAPFVEASRVEATRACALTGALLEILEVLQQHGIRALALKGPALAILAYGQPGCRSACDLDVLIHLPDLPSAQRVLGTRGFLPTGNGANLSGRKDVLLYREADGMTLELHWDLFTPGLHIRTESWPIWQNQQRLEASGYPVPTLGTEDTFLYSCIHGAVHRWSSLKWVFDLAGLLVRYPHVDWSGLLSRASDIGCRRMLVTGLVIASRISGVPLPERIVVAAAADSRVDALANAAISDLYSPSSASLDLAHPAPYRERWADRAAVLGEKLRARWRPTDADLTAVFLPSVLYPLYLLIRPVRLARVYGVRWLKALLA